MYKKFFLPLIIFLFLAGCNIKQQPLETKQKLSENILVDNTVSVVASYDTTEWIYNIRITCGADTFRTTSLPAVYDPDSLRVQLGFERLKRTTGWKNGYLFVRSDCGGGNAWNCNYDNVYTMINNRLHFLGTISCGDDTTIGAMYDGHYFRHLFDKFESNGLTSHAGAPGITLVMTADNGSFVVDIDKTWAENESYFNEKDSLVTLILNHRAQPEMTTELTDALLQNAVTAKYCNKAKQLAKYIRLAKEQFSGEYYQQFMGILSEVISGEYISVY